MSLKKSGFNKYSKYYYYELGDFLPQVNNMFLEHKLFSYISFTWELATLTILNIEKPEEVVIVTSPMAEAKLTACHEIQNLGAVESYQRRYLYMAALEIVEHDAIDASDNRGKPGKEESVDTPPWEENSHEPNTLASVPPAQHEPPPPPPKQSEKSKPITKAPAKRMFTIAKSDEEIVRKALKEFGYEKTGQVDKNEYDDVCKRIELLVNQEGGE